MIIKRLFFILLLANGALLAGVGEEKTLVEKADSLAFILAGRHSGQPVKCAFGLVNEIVLAARNTDLNGIKLPALLSRPFTDTSVVSPRGYFRVHYNTSGSEVPMYSIAELLLAADSSYAYETGYLGFSPPPEDNGDGGDTKYDIYILNLGGVYGFTTIEDEISPGSRRHTSFIMMDDDFVGFYTTGIEAARVTVAHEIHHGIQIGNYIVRKQGESIIDTWFYELTSTAMEEFVFDSVNDYYGYLASYFNGADRSFAQNSGYSTAHWNIFLRDRYSDLTIFRHQWELLKTYRALDAVQYSLTERGTSFQSSLAEFAVWCYFTNYRFKPGYFDEGDYYPAVRAKVGANMNSSTLSLQLLLKPASVNYIQTVNTRGGMNDTLFVIYTNGDVAKGIDSMNALAGLHMTLYDYELPGSKKITDRYYLKTEVQQPLLWAYSSVLNNFLIPSEGLDVPSGGEPYPSPFLYTRHTAITIPLENQRISGELDFVVFSPSMHQIYSSLVRPTYEGRSVVKWNPMLNAKNARLPSGVYLYILRTEGFVQKGKFTVINE